MTAASPEPPFEQIEERRTVRRFARLAFVAILLAGALAGVLVIAILGARHLGFADRLPLALQGPRALTVLQVVGAGAIVVGAAISAYVLWVARRDDS